MGPNENEHLEGTEIGTQEPYKHKIKISFFYFILGIIAIWCPLVPRSKFLLK